MNYESTWWVEIGKQPMSVSFSTRKSAATRLLEQSLLSEMFFLLNALLLQLICTEKTITAVLTQRLLLFTHHHALLLTYFVCIHSCQMGLTV